MIYAKLVPAPSQTECTEEDGKWCIGLYGEVPTQLMNIFENIYKDQSPNFEKCLIELAKNDFIPISENFFYKN